MTQQPPPAYGRHRAPGVPAAPRSTPGGHRPGARHPRDRGVRPDRSVRLGRWATASSAEIEASGGQWAARARRTSAGSSASSRPALLPVGGVPSSRLLAFGGAIVQRLRPRRPDCVATGAEACIQRRRRQPCAAGSRRGAAAPGRARAGRRRPRRGSPQGGARRRRWGDVRRQPDRRGARPGAAARAGSRWANDRGTAGSPGSGPTGGVRGRRGGPRGESGGIGTGGGRDSLTRSRTTYVPAA